MFLTSVGAIFVTEVEVQEMCVVKHGKLGLKRKVDELYKKLNLK